MRVVVLGGTGETGQEFVKQALDKGHQVTALVRNLKKAKLEHNNLQVFQVDVFNADEMADHVTGADVVVSCLGSSYQLIRDITMYSDTARAIVGAMRRVQVRRVVFISSWYLKEETLSDLPILTRFMKAFRNRFFEDMRKMEQYYVNECPDIGFTSVRPPELSNGPLTESDSQMIPDADYVPSFDKTLSRANLAKCILRIVEENLFVRKCVAVGLQN